MSDNKRFAHGFILVTQIIIALIQNVSSSSSVNVCSTNSCQSNLDCANGYECAMFPAYSSPSCQYSSASNGCILCMKASCQPVSQQSFVNYFLQPKIVNGFGNVQNMGNGISSIQFTSNFQSSSGNQFLVEGDTSLDTTAGQLIFIPDYGFNSYGSIFFPTIPSYFQSIQSFVLDFDYVIQCSSQYGGLCADGLGFIYGSLSDLQTMSQLQTLAINNINFDGSGTQFTPTYPFIAFQTSEYAPYPFVQIVGENLFTYASQNIVSTNPDVGSTSHVHMTYDAVNGVQLTYTRPSTREVITLASSYVDPALVSCTDCTFLFGGRSGASTSRHIIENLDFTLTGVTL